MLPRPVHSIEVLRTVFGDRSGTSAHPRFFKRRVRLIFRKRPASSSQLTLFIMLLAVAVFMPLILLYTSWVFHVLRGRVSLEEIRRDDQLY